MATKESFKERQENELQVLIVSNEEILVNFFVIPSICAKYHFSLQSIFGEENINDLRPTSHEDKWSPLDIQIKLNPQRDSKVNEAFCHATIRFICPKNYPKGLPIKILPININLKHTNVD
jgi:hypothetical protein